MGIFRNRVTVPVEVDVTAYVRHEVPKEEPKPKAKELRTRTTVEAFPPPSKAPAPDIVPDPVKTIEVVMKTGKRQTFEVSRASVGKGGELVLRSLQTVYPREWHDENLWKRDGARERRSVNSSLRMAFRRTTETCAQFTDAEFEAFPVKWEARRACLRWHEQSHSGLTSHFEAIERRETTFEHVIAPGQWKSYGVFHEASAAGEGQGEAA